MLCVSTKWCLNILTSQQSLLLPLPTLSGMDCSAKVATHSSMRRMVLSMLSRKESVKIQEAKFLLQPLEFKPKYSPSWTMRITTILILLKACSWTSIGDLDRVRCCAVMLDTGLTSFHAPRYSHVMITFLSSSLERCHRLSWNPYWTEVWWPSWRIIALWSYLTCHVAGGPQVSAHLRFHDG